MSRSPSYSFTTRWEVDAPPEEVYRALGDIDRLAEWWPSVYLDVRVRERGAPSGVGMVVDLHTKGFLPYTLRWRLRVLETDEPRHMRLSAEGDLCGIGDWRLTRRPDGGCSSVYDFQVEVDKPLLRWLSPILRPVFAANHRWAMAQGQRSLRLELRRRAARTEAERALVPPPPPPTFPHRVRPQSG